MGSETHKRDKNRDDENKHKRRRTRSRSPINRRDRDETKKRRRSRSLSVDKPKIRQKDASPVKENDTKKEIQGKKSKETDMLNTRTGGAYIPPARLRMMQAQITDKTSVAYQRLAWEALKKSIHGHINKINVGNIGIIIKQLLKENIVRGRGLLCRSVIQAQAASPTFTNVYAALVAAVNSRFPNIGELLLKRLVIQFKRGFKRNDKAICISSASFIAHLVNQRVAHEILALELLTLLVESPTDDSVEVAIAFLKECGQKLTEVSSKGVNAIFEMLRNILHEGQLDKRVQYMIEVMFQVWKDGFKDHPALIDELELVPEEEQFTHLLMLDDATDPQDILNVFKFDDKYEENEQKYKNLSKEILGSDAESGEDEEGSGSGSGSEESDDEEDAENKQSAVTIIDNTETNLIALRRTIYLTINSSLDFEECAHKLMKMQLKPGQEKELCHMFLDCCAEQRTYEKFFGLLAQRFCSINRIYIGPFEEIFKDSYGTAHRLDTNRLRNVSKFFAHLLFTDSISWEVLECVKLNEEDTTSSSRIYIKILFQELAEYMGLKKLNDRLKDPTLQEAFAGIFPRDNPKNTRFSINFFTSIGLGGLTDELREHLKQMPKNVPPPLSSINIESSESSSDSESSSESSDSSSSSDDSSSDSSAHSKSGKEKRKSKNKDKNSSKNNKQQAPEPEETQPEKEKETERWGHDGFYDTYGKDARRLESNPFQNRRDWNKDASSKDPKDRSDRHVSNRYDKDRGYENNHSGRDYEGDSARNSRNRKDRERYTDYKSSRENDRHKRDARDELEKRSDRDDLERGSKNEKRNNRDEYDKRSKDENRSNRNENEKGSKNEKRSNRDEYDKGSKDENRSNRNENERGSKNEKRSNRDEYDKGSKDENRSNRNENERGSKNEKRSNRDEYDKGSKDENRSNRNENERGSKNEKRSNRDEYDKGSKDENRSNRNENERGSKNEKRSNRDEYDKGSKDENRSNRNENERGSKNEKRNIDKEEWRSKYEKETSKSKADSRGGKKKQDDHRQSKSVKDQEEDERVKDKQDSTNEKRREKAIDEGEKVTLRYWNTFDLNNKNSSETDPTSNRKHEKEVKKWKER